MRTISTGFTDALVNALAASLHAAPEPMLVKRGKGGRKSVSRTANWLRPTRTTSSKPRDPNDPRQQALIEAAKFKRAARALRAQVNYDRCLTNNPCLQH
jgi:hypothetical protein